MWWDRDVWAKVLVAVGLLALLSWLVFSRTSFVLPGLVLVVGGVVLWMVSRRDRGVT